MRSIAGALTALLTLAGGAGAGSGAGPSNAPRPALAGVHGRVISTNGAPIPGVQLRLAPVDGDPSDARAATTDTAGVFAWSGLSGGQYRIAARRLGFMPIDVPFTVADGTDRQLTIQLTPVQQLDTVRTQTNSLTPARYGTSSRMDEFYRRKAMGVGKFITREKIDSMVAISSGDLLRGVPGITTQIVTGGDGGSFVLVHAIGCRGSGLGARTGADNGDGWGNVALYVNGVMVRGDRGLTLATLSPSEIEGIEVYRDPTELPAEAVGNVCAAVYVWTRVGADSSGVPR